MRKILATAAIGMLSAGALGTFASASQAAAPVNGTGTVTCSTVTGGSKFKPGLVLTGSAFGNPSVPAAVASKGAYSGCSGSGIATGAGKGASSLALNDCLALSGPSVDMNETIKWKGTTKLNASVVHYDTLTTDLTGTTLETTLSGTITSGSFAGESITVHQVAATGQDVAYFAGQCNAKKGLKGYSVVAGSLAIG